MKRIAREPGQETYDDHGTEVVFSERRCFDLSDNYRLGWWVWVNGKRISGYPDSLKGAKQDYERYKAQSAKKNAAHFRTLA